MKGSDLRVSSEVNWTSSVQQQSDIWWGTPRHAPNILLQITAFLLFLYSPTPHLQGSSSLLFLASAAAEVCVHVFQREKIKRAREILAIGQKGRWDRIQLSCLLCQRRTSSAKTSRSGEKGSEKENNIKKERNEMRCILLSKQVSCSHSTATVWGEEKAGSQMALHQAPSALWVGSWQAGGRGRLLRQLSCLNICSSSPSETGTL